MQGLMLVIPWERAGDREDGNEEGLRDGKDGPGISWG